LRTYGQYGHTFGGILFSTVMFIDVSAVVVHR
jgi:hypothetical protein